MSNFRVIKIIDANTIQVEPSWLFKDLSGEEITGDKVKILGLHASPTDEYVQHMLTSLLSNREVDLVNPVQLNSVDSASKIACSVIVDRTDITYYFEDYSAAPKRAYAF